MLRTIFLTLATLFIFSAKIGHSYEFTCIKGNNSYEMIKGKLYCGCLYTSWQQQDGQTCVGGKYNSWQIDQNGKALCGAIYNSWYKGDDGKYCVGGNYNSYMKNDDGTYAVGPLYNSYQTNPDGTRVCGGLYAKTHPKECGESSLVTIRSADELE